MRKMLMPTHIGKIIMSRNELFLITWGVYSLGMVMGYVIGKFT